MRALAVGAVNVTSQQIHGVCAAEWMIRVSYLNMSHTTVVVMATEAITISDTLTLLEMHLTGTVGRSQLGWNMATSVCMHIPDATAAPYANKPTNT